MHDPVNPASGRDKKKRPSRDPGRHMCEDMGERANIRHMAVHIFSFPVPVYYLLLGKGEAYVFFFYLSPLILTG